MQIDLHGRRALVTGGASGIGEATARLLTELGARVVIADLNAEALDAAAERIGAVGATSGDVASAADSERMVGEAAGALDGIDLLFNSAGVGDDLVPLHSQEIDRWQRIVDINLRGTYLVSRFAGSHMLAQKSGAIVNVSSIVGLGGFPMRTAYGSAKAAVAHFTKTLACEWGPSGIRVNCIAPAYTRTPMVQSLLDRNMFDPGNLEQHTPLGRLALPEEMAKAAVFLLSDWASYITGTVLPVDGGWGAYAAAGDVAG